METVVQVGSKKSRLTPALFGLFVGLCDGLIMFNFSATVALAFGLIALACVPMVSQPVGKVTFIDRPLMARQFSLPLVGFAISGWAWVVGPRYQSVVSTVGDARMLAAFLPVLVYLCPDWRTRMITTFAYYFVGSWVIPDSARVFFGGGIEEGFLGVLMWVFSALLLSGAWELPFFINAKIAGLLKQKHKPWSVHPLVLTLIALLIVSIPPIGIIGWLSPLQGAASLFPGMGTYGLVGLVAIWAATPKMVEDRRHLVSMLVLIIAAGVYANFSYSPLELPKKWYSQDTNFGPFRNKDANVIERMYTLMDLAKEPIAAGEDVILFPEEVSGRTDKALRTVIPRHLKQMGLKDGQIWMIGQEFQLTTGEYLNGIIIYSGTQEVGAFGSRQPVPISMWHPWTTLEHSPSDWFKLNVIALPSEGQLINTAFLFCFEEYLPWPALSSLMFGHVKVLGAVANMWWASSSAQTLQAYHSAGWAKMYGVPVFRAANRPALDGR